MQITRNYGDQFVATGALKGVYPVYFRLNKEDKTLKFYQEISKKNQKAITAEFLKFYAKEQDESIIDLFEDFKCQFDSNWYDQSSFYLILCFDDKSECFFDGEDLYNDHYVFDQCVSACDKNFGVSAFEKFDYFYKKIRIGTSQNQFDSKRFTANPYAKVVKVELIASFDKSYTIKERKSSKI